jgi:hypothetical protein
MSEQNNQSNISSNMTAMTIEKLNWSSGLKAGQDAVSWHTTTAVHTEIRKRVQAQDDTALHCTALHSTALHCTALHSIAQHCTA